MTTRTNEKPYDPEADAELWAEPIRKWASSGFLRGFTGLKSETIPLGKTRLPSMAFYTKALESLNSGEPDGPELERRMSYMEAVGERLRKIQSESINKHFRLAALGQFADLVVALLILGIILGLILNVGQFNPMAIVLMLLLGIKLLVVRHYATRVVATAHAAFRSELSLKMPWEVRP